MSAAYWACARPMSTNVAIHTNGLFSHTASATRPMVCAYNTTTETALRSEGMRRSSSRQPGAGRASLVSRSVGTNPASASEGGSIVVATDGILHSAEQMQEIRNTEI